jgi:hypothetical protein
VAGCLLSATEARQASPPADLPGLLNDGLSHPPPFEGAFGFNSFVPPNVVGQTYVDPAFGSTVRRLTTNHQPDDIYARNMFWNADGTKYVHTNQIVDTATGLVTHNVPIGSVSADSGFDPIDPNVYYYFDQNTIHRVVLSTTSAAIADSVFFEAPSEIRPLGGTVNWMDASGRYCVVRYGAGEPSIYLYDRLNMAAGPYTGALDGTSTVNEGGYVGLTPSGRFLVGYDDIGPARGVSWQIDHATRTVLAPNYFWSLCGDHGSFTSASDGRDYMVVANCQDAPEIWRVDITNNAVGLNASQQKALPNNQRLLAWPTWDDEIHFTSAARGPYRDWAFVSTADESDVFGSGTNAGGFVAPWRPYKQEIIGMNVITGEVRRIAHHRSRSIGLDYASQPRVSVSWGGEFVGWSTNVNQPGVTDVFAVPFALAAPAITDVAAMNVTNSTASIFWMTDQLSTSRVEYGPTTAYGSFTTLDTTQTAAHLQALTGLTEDTTYHYRVSSTNIRGLTSTSPDATFIASLPPAISGISATPAPFSATITWTTDQPADSQIIYGLTTAYGGATALAGALTTGHSQELLNLSHSTLYHFRVRSRNVHGMLTTSADGTFTTAPGVLVSNLTISNIQGQAAAFNWITDQPADTQIEYGLTTAYGSTTVLNPTLMLGHGQAVNTGLQPGTTYQFRVRSRNAAGVLGMSAGSFTTAPATVISAVTAAGVTGTSATITWTTDFPANSRIEYGLTNYTGITTLDPALVTSHSHTITGLTPGTTYIYMVRSITGQNTLTKVGGFSVTTLSTPVISNVNATNITGSTAAIGWTTSSPSDSQVEYGLTTAYGSTTTVPAAVTAHTAALTGLQGGTTYHYRVRSTNVVGSATSGDFTFTTLVVPPPIISGIVVTPLSSSSARITWTTDQAADSQIEYGPTTAYGTLSTLDSALVTSHSQTLTSLSPTTIHHFRVRSRNSDNLLTTSGDGTIALPPIVSNITISNVQGAAAAINWITDQPADTQIDYGLTTAYGSQTALAPALTLGHGQAINTGLQPGTTYHFRIRARNAAGALGTAPDMTFTTAPATVISSVAVGNLTGTTATITWTTDLPSNSRIEYGVGNYTSITTLDPALVTSHSHTITGLTPGVTYLYMVRSITGQNTLTKVGGFTVTTLLPPVVSSVASSNVGATAATITWTTNLAADSQVDYGLTTAYGSSTAVDPSAVTAHAVTLSGLAASTAYHYRVRSANGAGPTTSADFTFSTAAPPAPIVSNITISNIQGQAAAINWVTDQPADTQIEYGLTTNYGSTTALNPALMLNHGQAINSGLQPATTYQFRIRARNAAGLLGTSANQSFTTAPATVISNVAVANVTGTTATITWTTDLPANSRVEYGVGNYTSITTLDPALVTSHSHTITGLTPGTTYIYMVRSITGQNTLTKVGGFTVTTAMAPAISNVAATNVTGMSATISWTTNVASDSQVDYGPTTAYGSSTTVDPTAVTLHSMSLTGLTTGTTYHYRVRSASVGGSTTSGDFTFTATVPITLSAITVAQVTSSSATVTWTTDVQSDSFIEWGPTVAYGTSAIDPSLVTAHTVSVHALARSTTYHFRVRSANSGGAVTSGDFTFTTPDAPPAISNVVVSQIVAGSATVIWTTDIAADSQIEYGLTSSYGSTTTLDPALVTSHSQVITGLAAGSSYHLRATSRSSTGLLAVSGDRVLFPPPPVISNVTTSGITGTSATINWNTDQPATAQVEYGLTTAYGTTTTLNPAFTLTPSFTLNSVLTANTTYHFRVHSVNSFGHTGTSGDFTFTTAVAAVISNVNESLTGTTATITWTTDLPSNSRIEYGTTASYGSLTPLDAALVTSHSQTITGLTPGVTYFYQVRSITAQNILAKLGGFSFMAPLPPALSNIVAGNITPSSANINWVTNQYADSQVDYGLTTAYGTTTTLDPTPRLSHLVPLAGLVVGNTYHYRVRSTGNGGTTTSADFTFSTAITPVISGVSASTITGGASTITWTTDQPADSQIEYGTTTAYGSATTLDTSVLTSHSQTITGLAPLTAYHFRIRSQNVAGLLAVSADGVLLPPAPTVSNVTISNIQGQAAAINWVTNQPSDTQIEYGLTTNYGFSTVLAPALVTNHGQAINANLLPGTLHHFRVRSRNAAGVLGTSADMTFTTAPATVISAVTVANVTSTTATITWTTDLPSNSRIEYGVTNYTAITTLDPALVTSHTHTITGLTPGVTYIFMVRSITGQNTLTKVGGFFFTTPQ